MQTVQWEFYPLVSDNSVTHAFIEELAQVGKSPSTIDNYSRDLEDFLQANASIPFSTLLEADESQIARYVGGLWSRPARRGSGHKASREKITYVTGSNLSLNTIRRRVSTVRVFYDWCIRVRKRQDQLNPVPRGVRGKERGLISYAPHTHQLKSSATKWRVHREEAEPSWDAFSADSSHSRNASDEQ